jgi:hypothetical protein
MGLELPEKVLRAAHMTFVHAIFLRSPRDFRSALRSLSAVYTVQSESATRVVPAWHPRADNGYQRPSPRFARLGSLVPC